MTGAGGVNQTNTTGGAYGSHDGHTAPPDRPRLIEFAFPLKQASLDSVHEVHEKNVRHGHISTLHIWPARRPLAASRAALIATLLPDPGTAEGRRRLEQKMGGVVVPMIERKKLAGKIVEVERQKTVGGVLHWGRTNQPRWSARVRHVRFLSGGTGLIVGASSLRHANC